MEADGAKMSALFTILLADTEPSSRGPMSTNDIVGGFIGRKRRSELKIGSVVSVSAAARI